MVEHEPVDPAAPGAAPADDGRTLFRLYVSAASPISARAVVNIRRFLEKHLPERHRLVVLYIGENVASARADQIIASPTLVRVGPGSLRRCIGDMSDEGRLRAALGLKAEPGKP